MSNFSEKKFGGLVRRTLSGGVLASVAFFLSGFAMKFSGLGPAAEMFSAGALALLVTPAARVAMLLYGYLRKGEYRFALAAAAVLFLLGISVLL